MAGVAGDCEAVGHYFKYALSDGGDGGFVRDHDYAVLIASCDLAILFIDSGVELVAFALEAIFVGAGLLDVAIVATTGALERGGEGREEEEGRGRATRWSSAALRRPRERRGLRAAPAIQPPARSVSHALLSAAARPFAKSSAARTPPAAA